MKSDGKVSFDQGIVVNNNDPKKLGRVKVRMITDGIDTPDTMHKGDDELHWYEPCILGAGYEVGSLTVPPVGSYLWCLECKFNTENVYRVYLGSAYGTGPQNSKNFNAMLTPPEVLETPSEALINYPYSQLLYKSTQGSYLRFYGDTLAGFDLCTGIPIRDKNGNYSSEEHYTYNYIYGDREELMFSVSEMPDPIDKASPADPEDIPISYIQMTPEKIFSGVVRDRFGDTFNHQLISPTGIFMKVRGTGGVSSPSENKELEDNLAETASNAEETVARAAEKATEEVTKENGPLETQTKNVENQVDQKAAEAAQTPYKIDNKAVGKTKKEMSLFQERFKLLAVKVPGGYGFIQSAMASAVKGNFKALTYHILSAVASNVFSLAAGLVRDTFNSLLSNPNIVNTEEASKFVSKIIGEANLGSLVGKASTMIASIGGKLGPFGQLFERAANHVLGVVTGKIGYINRINNKLGSMAEILKMLDQLKPTMNTLISQGISASVQSSGSAVIAAVNQAMIQGRPADISKIEETAVAQMAGSLGVGGGFSFGNKTAAGTSVPNGTDIPSNENNTPITDDMLPGDLPAGEISGTPQTAGSSAESNASDSNAQGLTSEEKQTLQEYAEIVNKAAQETLSDALNSVTGTLISKTLSYASEETEQEAVSETEYENVIYLDAEGARAIIPGEEISNACNIDNDGAEVKIGEDCLFQMTPSNIMSYVGNPEKTNQSALILASDGLKTEINMGATKNTEITNSAESNSCIINNGAQKAVFEQKPDRVTLKVGENGSLLEMTESQITLKMGTSHIVIKEGEISIGAVNVNIGAGVTLGYLPLGFGNVPQICYFDAPNIESRKAITWKVDRTINFN